MSADGLDFEEQKAAIGEMGITNAENTIEEMASLGQISDEDAVTMSLQLSDVSLSEAQRFDAITRITTRPARIEAAKGDQLKLLQIDFKDNFDVLKARKVGMSSTISDHSDVAKKLGPGSTDGAAAAESARRIQSELDKVNADMKTLKVDFDKAKQSLRNPARLIPADTKAKRGQTPEQVVEKVQSAEDTARALGY